MTMPSLPPAGNRDWRDGWASAVHDAAAEVVEGRLTEEALRAAFGSAIVEAAQGPGVTLTALPGGLYNVKGQNAVAYTQDPVTTVDGIQYAIWSDSDRHPVVGKRVLPGGVWTTFDLADLTGNPMASPTVDDLHNSYVIAVDDDGYLHASGNLHADPLTYVRSANPHDITAWETPGMVGTDENDAGYPQFVRMPDGELLFVYRNGSSGNGDVFINAYDLATKTWSRRSMPLKGTAPVDPDESPYTNKIAVGADGSLHVFYMWRSTGSFGDSHDISYIRSPDAGVTWETADGTALDLPVTPDTEGPIILAGWPKGALNQSGAGVDSTGRPHSAWWMDNSSDAAKRWGLHHVWHDGTDWQDDTILSIGYAPSADDMARPAVICHGDRTYIVYVREPAASASALWMRDVTPTPAVQHPEVLLLQADLGRYEPVFDTRALAERGELNMLVTPIQPAWTGIEDAYTDTWGAILSLDLDRVRTATVARSARVAAERVWIPPSRFLSVLGLPAAATVQDLSVPHLRFDPAAHEIAAATADVPLDWRQFDIELWWTSVTADAGNVVFNRRYKFQAVGVNATGGPGEINLGNLTLTAPAQYIATKTVIGSPIRPPNGSIFYTNLRRIGADAADTFPADIAVLGLTLTRTA